MKALKFTEKVLFIIATAVLAVALAFGGLLDASYIASGYPSLALAIQPYCGQMGLVAGVGILLAAAFVRYNKHVTVARIADGVVIAYFALAFVLGLTVTGGLTLILGLVASIVYVVSALIRLITAIVERVKPVPHGEDYDPDNDEKIKNIVKWKGLLDKGIITKDEFAAKRAAILSIEETEE